MQREVIANRQLGAILFMALMTVCIVAECPRSPRAMQCRTPGRRLWCRQLSCW